MERQAYLADCLTQAQTFETLWAYYSQSGGQLYDRECRKMAIQFVESYEELTKLDTTIQDDVARSIGVDTDIPQIIEHMKEWGRGTASFPYTELLESRLMMFALLSSLKGTLLHNLNVKRWPVVMFTSSEMEYTARVVRWKAHMPHAALRDNPDKLITAASSTTTIAVIGDIRRSQDLMTYALNQTEFAQKMEVFISKTRELIEKHSGLFDKFTGDGFVVYFNESICSTANQNYVACFLNFLREELEFTVPFFQEWTRPIRKRPEKNIGLALGADIGQISFKDINNHLIAVGSTIVWASRMAATADSGKVMVNNMLYAALNGSPDVNFCKCIGHTKSGEDFLAQELRFNVSSVTD
jgi:class 3 adenylate cyclase